MTNASFSVDYNKNNKIVKAYIRQSVKNEAIVEDIAAIALTKVFNSLDVFNPSIASETSWILQITKNCIIDYSRSKAYKNSLKTVNVSDFVDESGNETFEIPSQNLPSDLIEGKELKKAIAAALANLSPNAQKAFNLFYVQNRKYEEISEILGISMSNVKVTLLRAKAAMQTSLQPTYASL